MINGKAFFNQPMKNDLRTYDNIQKMATGQRGNQTAGCLLDYVHLKCFHKMTAIELRKQQELDGNPKSMQ